MVPEAIAPGNGAIMSDTSRPWPFATILRVSAPLPKVTFTLEPVLASKLATIFWVGARIGPTASNVISLCWACRFNQLANTNVTMRIDRGILFIFFIVFT